MQVHALPQIKEVDINKRACKTIIGTGCPGNAKGDNWLETELNEPGGITHHPGKQRLYIADTNNCDVKVVEMESQRIYSVRVSIIYL